MPSARRTSLRTRAALLLRGSLVGGLATLVDLATLALLVHGVGLGPRLASPLALSTGVIVQFAGSKLFTFRDRSGRWGPQAATFLLVEVLAFALNLGGFDALVVGLGVPAIPARIAVSAAVYAGVCLPLWSLVFRPTSPRALGGEPLARAEG